MNKNLPAVQTKGDQDEKDRVVRQLESVVVQSREGYQDAIKRFHERGASGAHLCYTES